MKRAADVLSKLLDENSRGKAQSYCSVFGGWRDLAGLSLADHSRVYEVKHNDLFVEVDHNGWMQILLLRKARILSKLRVRYPELEIRDLKVRINPSMSLPTPETRRAGKAVQAEPSRPTTPQVVPADASPAGDEAVDQVVSGVRQEPLKRQLKKLFLSSLKDKRERP